jgi:hypothetical protein
MIFLPEAMKKNSQKAEAVEDRLQAQNGGFRCRFTHPVCT